MSRVLIVAYYFPPLGGVASLRTLGHARFLPEHGWDTVVLAPRGGAYHRDERLAFPTERVVRTRTLELSRIAKRLLRTGGDDVREAEVGSGRGALRTLAHQALYFPDAHVGWAPFALAAGRRELRRAPVDAIVSSSFPITAHVVARRLARQAGVPWVAEFRDPWSEMLPNGRRRRRAAGLERSLARAADAVVMTSPSWADHHAALWGRRVAVIPNGHDLDGVPASAPPGGLVLGYVGTYYPDTQASLESVWRAARDVSEIRVIGVLHPVMRAQLRDHGLLERVRETGFLPNDEALRELASCSAALLAGPIDADGILVGQVAGKVWEYLATDLPVIYVGPLDADVARMLRTQAGTALAAPGDDAAVAAALGAARAARFARDASGFSRRARAGALAALLDGLIGDGQRAA